VAHADPDAEIGLGLKPGSSRRAILSRPIHENRAEELLNWIKVFAGDMIYVCRRVRCTRWVRGSIIVETQQQSDTTFSSVRLRAVRASCILKEGLRVIKEKVASGKSQASSVLRNSAATATGYKA